MGKPRRCLHPNFPRSDFLDGGLITIFSPVQSLRQIRQDGSRIAKEEEPLVHLQGDAKGKVEEKVVTQPHHRSQLVGSIALRICSVSSRKI
jgi:hypothetical protein